MMPVDTLIELIERVERAMRPLSSGPQSPDHDRVREVYMQMLTDESDDPLEKARLKVLHEIVQPYLTALQQTLIPDTSAVVHHVKAAIGALVMLLCHLDDRDFDAAHDALTTTLQVLRDVQELLKTLQGNVAHA